MFAFQGTFINRTFSSDEVGEAKTILIQSHGRSIMRALLSGFAGVAPRSATPNLIELLSTLVSRFPAQCKTWMAEILFAVSTCIYDEAGLSCQFQISQDDFVPSKAGPEAKEKFVKAALRCSFILLSFEGTNTFKICSQTALDL